MLLSYQSRLPASGTKKQSSALRCLTSVQGAAAQQEAARLTGEVEREQANVKAALQALEAEKARMAAKAAAEKERLLEKVGGLDPWAHKPACHAVILKRGSQ